MAVSAAWPAIPEALDTCTLTELGATAVRVITWVFVVGTADVLVLDDSVPDESVPDVLVVVGGALDQVGPVPAGAE